MSRVASVCVTLVLVGIMFSCGTPIEPLPPSEFRPLTSTEAKLVAAANDFGLNLFREINAAEPDGNVFIAPVSVSLALGMTMNGAANGTLGAMQQTLGFGGLDEDAINESYRGLIGLLTGLDPAVTMQIANSIWYYQGFPFKESFLESNREYFDAEVAGLNFSSPESPSRINNWVKSRTGGHIEKIVPDKIPDDIVMYLINAIYFKGDWKYRFDTKKTRNGQFRLPDGSTKEVKMMSREMPIRYAITEEYVVVDLPYGNGFYTMTIVMPDGIDEIESFAADLNERRWNEITSSLPENENEIMVHLPRFRLEYQIKLNETLKKLGMAIAFDADYADFSRMYHKELYFENLYISTVDHKTYIDVNEEGTVAAAATSVGVTFTSLKPEILVDRPFIFAIRENHSGSLVFMGKIMNPDSK